MLLVFCSGSLLYSEYQSISSKCCFTRFAYLCAWAHTSFYYFSSLHAKMCRFHFFSSFWKVSDLSLHRTQCFPVFVSCSKIINLLVLDAYPPCLCVCKSYPSWEGYLIKPSLIMYCMCCGHFSPTYAV